MGRDVASFITGVIIIAILFVLVRPNSQGPQLVSTVGQSFVGLLQAATGGGGFTASGGTKLCADQD